jgi:hypothetical protein
VTGRSIIALVSAPSGFAGRTKPVQVGTPQWHDTEPVNQALERVLGVPTSVLRLVSAKSWETNWLGEVTYHVEAHGEPNRARLFPAGEPEADAPRRLPWARPGGPAELVAWADAAIDRTGPAAQVKTWHMSSVHRLPTAAGPAWLKAVPPFLADEGRVIRMVAAHDPALVPEVIASAPHRVLLGDAPGGDCWKVEPEDIERIVPRWVAVQHALAGEPREPGLRSSVVPMPSFGLPDTVVHGDFSPINWTRNGVVLGWSSAVWGHPALDVGRLLEYCRHTMYDHVAKVWSDAWLRHRPDSRPFDALEAGLRAACLQNAVKYQEVLDGIEDSQRIYHRDYPSHSLTSALRAVATP